MVATWESVGYGYINSGSVIGDAERGLPEADVSASTVPAGAESPTEAGLKPCGAAKQRGRDRDGRTRLGARTIESRSLHASLRIHADAPAPNPDYS